MGDHMDRECRAERACNAMGALHNLVLNTEDLGGLMPLELASLLDIVFSEARKCMPYSVLSPAANDKGDIGETP